MQENVPSQSPRSAQHSNAPASQRQSSPEDPARVPQPSGRLWRGTPSCRKRPMPFLLHLAGKRPICSVSKWIPHRFPIKPSWSITRSQSKAVAPEASPERSCSLHSCPLEDPSSSSGPPPATSTLQPVGPSSPLAPAHFTYPRAPQEHRGASSLPGLGDRAGLCSHGSSLSPSPAPSQRDGTWKPASVQHHVVSVR